MNQSRFVLVACLVAPILYGACSAKPPAADSSEDSDDFNVSSGGHQSPDGHGTGATQGGDDIDITNPPPGENCGDGVRQDNEACDDKNQDSGDGCSMNCLMVEPGFICRQAGEPCFQYAVCGDGVVSFPEQCDDGGLMPGDGCSDLCKFEIGYTCDGSPSECRETKCGDGVQEGAETCEGADGLPFDGCSTICQGEPACTDAGCTSSCGDGLIIGDEECDDGNGVSGDGCSAECKEEPGYTCEEAAPCEGDACTLVLPIVFRDFDTTHTDFFPPSAPGAGPCDGIEEGLVSERLDASGKPTLAGASECISSAQSFAEWYGSSNTFVREIVLYPNGKGGFVNRFGENGEKYQASIKTPNEQTAGTSPATCETNCRQRARDAQAPFTGQSHLRCDDLCRDFSQDAQQLRDGELNQANIRLTQAEAANPPDEDLIAEIEAEIEEIEAEIADLLAEAETCMSDCEEELDERTATCAATCAPCSFNPDQYCIGGEVQELDGNPLFFPIDDAPNAPKSGARIPAQIYGGIGWPWEGGDEASSPPHNFHFTSEIAYWFKYEEGMTASFEFIGDDDVWVFVNRRLLIDLGGIHVPLIGQFEFAANGNVTYRSWTPPDPGEGETMNTPIANGTTSVADLGLAPGGVYEIKVFHAERKPEGSSFQLTLSGFNNSRSVCKSHCGDGIIAAGEQCDDGTENNTGGFNKCGANCTLGAFCGDGIVQEADGEECDDGDPNKPKDCYGCHILQIF